MREKLIRDPIFEIANWPKFEKARVTGEETIRGLKFVEKQGARFDLGTSFPLASYPPGFRINAQRPRTNYS